MVLLKLQFRGVLNRHHPLALPPMNEESAFSIVVLPDPVPPEISTFSRASTKTFEKGRRRFVQRPDLDHAVERQRHAGEFADRERRARQWRRAG